MSGKLNQDVVHGEQRAVFTRLNREFDEFLGHPFDDSKRLSETEALCCTLKDKS